ncbi:arylesterase [Thiocapsa bogorovii]|uniref:LplL n=1 Tax=Thiocapsa roseopersicina TaxID=1058 RepID=A0A1Z2RRF9_THIRO|nr:arylesterase [Thiocapsa bogorovii]ASA46432.1 LplL [Thiocapsa roseopersicina]UHD14781.1 arylesterase [Thiocapsa bogorovii]
MIRLLLLTCMLLPALTLGKTTTDAPAAPPVILVLGDSLSASYGLDRESGWVSLLEERLRERGMVFRVVNASVSGDTTAGGLTRLGTLLDEHAPTLVLIELGANDGLRGLGFEVIRNNIIQMIERSRTSGSRVLLTGLRLPPNYGAAYTDGFQAVFREVAEAESVPLVPDLLAGVAENWDLMQADGLHPTAEAQPRILDNVWPVLEPLLESSR